MDKNESTPTPAAVARGAWLRRPVPLRLAGLAIVLALLVAYWFDVTLLWGRGGGPVRRPGIGNAIALDSRKDAWGFNLEPANIHVSRIVVDLPARDVIPALSKPDSVTADAISDQWNVLLGNFWVAGVVAGGEARAYPATLLASHECINDVVGGVPVAVAYSGLSDALAAFSRRIGGRTIEFGVSGLLYQSNRLLFDRRTDPHDESLWSPGLMRAVTGPAAGSGLALEPIDIERTEWRDWLARHPETTVATFNTGFNLNYYNDPMAKYFKHDAWLYPPDGRTDRRPPVRGKRPLVVVRAGEAERAYLLSDIRNAGGAIEDRLGGVRLRLTVEKDRHCDRVRVDPIGAPADVIRRRYIYWGVWDALYPKGDLYAPPAGSAK